jgi:hypothetical protein
MVAVARKPILDEVFGVAHTQAISRELDAEDSSAIEETRSFIMDPVFTTICAIQYCPI